ncbi:MULTISPECIES: CBS domain-containing protein [Thermocrispum]|jgi:CBS domain-containing protein|uniref:CBS domain-containing protein n=1 Tax=Thermocrispum agreste TaxID=37925 RepID=A0A2W4JIK0_9PSEU|nr:MULTISPECIES: CBS domain-containing protein [Thermocrispum]PZM97745.1 MAG: CBS domain-containing protein [Thermocrispum agreste]
MRIAEVLRKKGSDVATISPDATVTELLAVLAERNVGALVVVENERIVGIVSERDVVRRAHERGAAILSAKVAEIMTTDVATCDPAETVDHLTVLMTQRRIRHVPVIDNGRLCGIVSIGDVVKNRMDELEEAQKQLQAYILQG